jgi:hypothetical protein
MGNLFGSGNSKKRASKDQAASSSAGPSKGAQNGQTSAAAKRAAAQVTEKVGNINYLALLLGMFVQSELSRTKLCWISKMQEIG